MFSEDDLLPLSALQHFLFCERQCALIHIEQAWRDNPLTLEGSFLHRRADRKSDRREKRGDILIVRHLPLRSYELGLSGRADVVEFHQAGRDDLHGSHDAGRISAVSLPEIEGMWRPFPVEYKHGKPKWDMSDSVQICAQALCLEEMLGIEIRSGALFYGKIQRRWPVVFDGLLRGKTRETAERLRKLILSGRTPLAGKEPKCRNCSLLNLCLPKAMPPGKSSVRYLEKSIRDALRPERDPT